MRSHDIVAYTMGYVLISNATSAKNDIVRDIAPEERTRLQQFIEEAMKLTNEIVSISVRWLALNIERASARDIIQELGRAWMTRSPTFSEYTYFLKGAFEVRDASKLTPDEVMLIMTELDRVGEGVPLRYQQLYFELAPYANKTFETIDFDAMRVALKHAAVNFPKLELPVITEEAAPVDKQDEEAPKEASPDAGEGKEESLVPVGDTTREEQQDAATREEQQDAATLTADKTTTLQTETEIGEPASSERKTRPHRSKKKQDAKGIDL